jgi:hypothetical protein
MSKSTPISNLPNMNQPAESNENELVNEILQEIEGSQNNSDQNIPENPPQNIPQNPPVNIPEMSEEQMNMTEEPNFNEQVLTQEMVNNSNSNNMMEEQRQLINQQQTQQNKSFTENLLDMIKMPAIVGIIVMVLSIPKLSEILSSILPKKEVIQKYSEYIIILIKGLLGAGSYFALNQNL